MPEAFAQTYGVKYEKAVDCLKKDREPVLALYDFPAEHWKHLRTTNPIESSFATVRHRTIRSKGCLSDNTALAMVFKLVETAQKNWRRLDGHTQLPKLIQGVKITDGIEAVRQQPQAAAWPRPSPRFSNSSAEIEAKLKEKALKSRVHRNGHRNKPLSEREKRGNKTHSKVRARVEHVFGAQSNDTSGTLVRRIGLVRAKARIGLKNLAYNMRRLVQFERLAMAGAP